jgi:hypothetical protein
MLYLSGTWTLPFGRHNNILRQLVCPHFPQQVEITWAENSMTSAEFSG